jgi:Tfp pilus assembly protein PilN
MELRLNLSTSPRENHRPFLAATAAIGILGILALAFLSRAALRSWRSNREIRTEVARLENEIRRERQQQQALENYFRSPQAQQILDRSAFLNSLIDQRAFPWTKVFMDLEQTLPPGVRVVSIAPKLENGRALIELTIGAATDEGKLKFLETLEKSVVFSGIQVKDEKHQDQAGASDKILLDLRAWYATS